jgi:hypothetical protein
MTLNDLGNLGEFVSAVAVVVSLVYLAVQVRQNTRMMRVSTHHALNTAFNALHVAYGSDPAVSTFLNRASEDYSQLDRDERLRYALLMRASFGLHNDWFLQAREGLFSEEEWTSQTRAIARALAPPGARAWWERDAEIFPEAFQREISRILAAQGSERADQTSDQAR